MAVAAEIINVCSGWGWGDLGLSVFSEPNLVSGDPYRMTRSIGCTIFGGNSRHYHEANTTHRWTNCVTLRSSERSYQLIESIDSRKYKVPLSAAEAKINELKAKEDVVKLGASTRVNASKWWIFIMSRDGEQYHVVIGDWSTLTRVPIAWFQRSLRASTRAFWMRQYRDEWKLRLKRDW